MLNVLRKSKPLRKNGNVRSKSRSSARIKKQSNAPKNEVKLSMLTSERKRKKPGSRRAKKKTRENARLRRS